MKITFLGATEEVTGSKYLLENKDIKILIDCGLYQGEGAITKRNWDIFPIDPSSIQAIILTHAHLDHTGYIPVLIKKGFKGKIYCSKATYAMTAIVLKDSGFVQEMDAKKANASGFAHHATALPLYTEQDAKEALSYFYTVNYDTVFSIGTLTAKLIRSGHILGSSFVVISDGTKTLSFSGDLGRPNDLIMKSPPHLLHTDFLVLESTYGGTLHEKDDPLKELSETINTIITQNGTLIIPAFAIERTQTILYSLYLLKEKKIIPEIPIFLDSPMAISITQLFSLFSDEHKLSPQLCQKAFSIATFLPTVEDSKRLNHLQGPAIIIAGSGMADGGRVLHHLMHCISNPKNIVLFVGFQAPGTHGQALIDGANQIKINDDLLPVRATIKQIKSYSAHADYNEILQWLSFFESNPKTIFLTHGELKSSEYQKKKKKKKKKKK